jgi:hypothetical protein
MNSFTYSVSKREQMKMHTPRHLMRGFTFAVSAMAVASVLSVASVKSADAKSFSCNPVDVAEFPNSRVHVRCSPADGAIAFFALGVSRSGDADRTLNLATDALINNKRLTIFYDPADTSGAGIGCLTSNCRLIQGIIMF